VNVGEHHNIELQALCGLGIDDEDTACREAQVALRLARGVGDNTGMAMVQYERTAAQLIEPADARVVIRRDNAEL
jgi:hypothetical protein